MFGHIICMKGLNGNVNVKIGYGVIHLVRTQNFPKNGKILRTVRTNG